MNKLLKITKMFGDKSLHYRNQFNSCEGIKFPTEAKRVQLYLPLGLFKEDTQELITQLMLSLERLFGFRF